MLTVFTPTYNREHLLLRLYESLKKQSCKDFVWLIVDDGSTDNTKSLIESFIAENQITIRYFYQENGGKMRAHNYGVSLCDTELFFCVDSDDWIVDTAVETIINIWNNKISCEHCIRKIGGIVAHKGKTDKELLGEKYFPEGIESSTLRNLYRKGFSGETSLVFKTEALKKYYFPEYDGEKYVPEDVVYDRIDSEYELIVLDAILTVCEIVSQGYTDQAKRLRNDNPNGWYIYYEQRMKSEPFSVLKIKYISHYLIFAKKIGKKPFKDKKIARGYLVLGLIGSAALKLLGKT